MPVGCTLPPVTNAEEHLKMWRRNLPHLFSSSNRKTRPADSKQTPVSLKTVDFMVSQESMISEIMLTVRNIKVNLSAFRTAQTMLNCVPITKS